MESSRESVIVQAREHTSHGRRAAAVNLLQEALAIQNDIALATELGETLFSQGYTTRAVDLLEKYIIQSSNEFSGDLSAVFGARMLYLYARFHATAQFKEALREAATIYEAYSLNETYANVNENYLRIETYYCSLHTMAGQCGEISSKFNRSTSLHRLRTAFENFKAQRDFYNALSAARTIFACSPESDSSLLQQLLEQDGNVPELYQAEARFSMAKTLDDPKHKDEQDTLYSAALQVFEKANHAHRSLDIKIRLACRYPLDPEGPPVESIISELLQAYEQVDNPTGLLAALLAYLSLAERLSLPQAHATIFSDFEQLCKQLGSQLNWYLARISSLAMLAKSGKDYGNSIRSGKTLWADLEHSDCSVLRCQAAQLVAQAYYALNRNEKAAEWWSKVQEHPRALGPVAIPLLARDIEKFGHDRLEQTFHETFRLAEIDATNGPSQLAIDKLVNFLNDALILQESNPAYIDIVERTIALSEQYNNALPDSATTRKARAHLRQSKASLLLKGATLKPNVEAEMQAIAAGNEARQLYLAESLYAEAAMVLQQQALIYIGIFQKFEKWRDPQAQEVLQKALDLYQTVLDSAIGLNLSFLAMENAFWVAHCQYRQWERGWRPYDTVLSSLLHAESLIDRRRRELSVLNKVEAIDAKRRLSSDAHSRLIYQMAINISILCSGPIEAWSWVQKSKARSLSDVLGLGIFIPRELEARIKKDAVTAPLFEQEQAILGEMQTAVENDRFSLRLKLDIIQEQMQQHDDLKELIALREGHSVKFEALRDISFGQNEKPNSRPILFIDWIIIQNQIQMCVARPSGQPVFFPLSVSVDAVKSWISKHLNSDSDPASVDEYRGTASSGLYLEDSADQGPLRELDPLVAPLQIASDRNDLLVLCPSGILHSLPLHALRIEDTGEYEVLIARNPIIFCASLTSFAQCSQRAAPDDRRGELEPSRFFAVYEPWYKKDLVDDMFTVKDQDETYASVKSLAESFTGTALTATKVTRESLTDSLQTCSMVHFLGHCDFDTKPVSEQALQLSDGRHRDDGSCTIEPFFVTDILTLPIRSLHISILGCGTASQHYEAGDEPLGLVSAFLAAGASSVLGALWPIETTTARMFSEKFYAYIREDENCRRYGVYDLAYAVREAVLDVRASRRTRQPYQWAPFVLHGTWFMSGVL